jgi:hypothetical protein
MSIHHALIIILILIPGSTLHDWEHASSPTLHALMQSSYVGLMTTRTAERESVTAVAGARTIAAGARLGPSPATDPTDYLYQPDNLVRGLADSGWIVSSEPGTDPVAAAFPSTRTKPKGAAHGLFLVLSSPLNAPNLEQQLKSAVRLQRAAGAVIIALSPSPTPSEYRVHDRLTPLLISLPGLAGGIVASPSTRATGIVQNTDIAPTIAKLAGATLPSLAYGKSVTVMPKANTLAYLDSLAEQCAIQERAQDIVPYIAGLLAALFVLPVVLKSRHMAKLLLPLSCAPLILLTRYQPSTCLILFAVLFGLALSVAWQLTAMLDVAAAATFAYCLADAVFAGHLFPFALLAPSPQEAARFYGLGNEAMGAMIGAATVLTCRLKSGKLETICVVFVWLVIGAALGLPMFGAKVGGVPSALAAAAGVLAARWQLKPKATSALVLGAVALAFAGLCLIAHFAAGAHLTETLARANHEGAISLLNTFRRRTTMDVHLIVHSVWMLVLLVGAAGLIVRMPRDTSDLPATAVQLRAASAVAIVACAVFNDAGIVAAALCAMVCVPSFLADRPAEQRAQLS